MAPEHTELNVRERLLDTAELLFAERGFVDASVREITGAACCNIAAVNYYFGGKDGLYREVFHRRLDTLRERRIARIRTALDESGSKVTLEGILQAFAEAFLEPFVTISHGRRLLRLISREMIEPRLPAEMFRAELVQPVRQVLLIAVAKAAQGINPEDAELCVQSLIAQLAHAITMRRMRDEDTSGPPSSDWLASMTRHIVRFSAAGIRAYTTGDSR